MKFYFVFALVLSIWCSLGFAEEAIYEGVGTCASSGCHGRVSPHSLTNVLQNEYYTWSRYDQHSKAFEHLTNEQGLIIAAHLGIKNPDQDKQCLSCHSTYVTDPSLKGRLFRLEEGVGCESCHGASSRYLKTHARKKSTHQQNLDRGLTKLTDPKIRAEVCLDCHASRENEVIYHKLYAAGHPRIVFELDTFSYIMPQHWRLDEDYKHRKGPYEAVQFWLVGQILRSKRMMSALYEHLKNPTQGLLNGPDFAVMNCYGCHHRLKDNRWKTGLILSPLGQPQLNLSSPTILHIVFNVLDPEIAKDFSKSLGSLRDRPTTESVAAMLAVLKKAENWIDKTKVRDGDLKQKIAEKLLRFSSQPQNLNYEVAEQVVMALSALSLHHKNELDQMYSALKDPSAFQVPLFKRAVKALLNR